MRKQALEKQEAEAAVADLDDWKGRYESLSASAAKELDDSQRVIASLQKKLKALESKLRPEEVSLMSHGVSDVKDATDEKERIDNKETKSESDLKAMKSNVKRKSRDTKKIESTNEIDTIEDIDLNRGSRHAQPSSFSQQMIMGFFFDDEEENAGLPFTHHNASRNTVESDGGGNVRKERRKVKQAFAGDDMVQSGGDRDFLEEKCGRGKHDSGGKSDVSDPQLADGEIEEHTAESAGRASDGETEAYEAILDEQGSVYSLGEMIPELLELLHDNNEGST